MTSSPWLESCRPAIDTASGIGPVVDLACGRGRNALALACGGTPVIGIDRNRAHLGEFQRAAAGLAGRCEGVRADLEASHGFPLKEGTCGVILVFRFLFRPLAQQIASALAPGGVLVYETFTIHQRAHAYGPRSDAFLLQPDELAKLFPGLETEEHWEGSEEGGDRPEAVARLLARKR